MKEIIKSLLLASKGTLSSKRFCGILGWIVVLGISIYCSTKEIQAPYIIDTVTITSAALLGVDSITNAFKRGKVE